MARALRLDFPGAVHHVTARGVDQRDIFVNDLDRHLFLRALHRVAERCTWRRLSYCLMGNHYHLLVATPEGGLAAGMQRLNGDYAQGFNRRHRRSGHLFQDRYGSRLVRTDEHLLAAARYIAMNPVAAGLCAEPGDWPWSDHRLLAGLNRPGPRTDETLLTLIGATIAEGRARYLAFIADHPLGEAT